MDKTYIHCGVEFTDHHKFDEYIYVPYSSDATWHAIEFTEHAVPMRDERSIVRCRAVTCKHNLAVSPLNLATCNQKFVTVSDDGKCKDYEERK